MNLLIDTNVFIAMEPTAASAEALESLAKEVASLASRGGHCLYRHPDTEVDLRRDRNAERKSLRFRQVERYPLLQDPPSKREVERLLGSFTDDGSNSAVDNAMLAALHADAVDYLVAEDAGIHRKARRLNLAERVVDLATARDLLAETIARPPTPPLHVESVKCHALDSHDPIFGSLSGDYQEFTDWFAKVKREQRDSLRIVGEDGKYAAIAILKSENNVDGPSLKICTFKVSLRHGGNKFGELLLRAIFQYCGTNRLRSVYATAFPKHEALIALFENFGFVVAPERNERGEHVLRKQLVPPAGCSLDPLEHHICYGPPAISENARAFLIPIQPAFHDALFPDVRAEEPQLPLFLRTPRPYGCAIRKAYVCHSKNRQLLPGDALFFYRSTDAFVQCVGVVEQTHVVLSASDVRGLVGFRTVYTDNELVEMANGRELLVITFRYDRAITKVPKAELEAEKVIKRAPQSIMKVSENGLGFLRTRLKESE